VADPVSRQRHSRPSGFRPAAPLTPMALKLTVTVGGEFSGADLLVQAAGPLLFAGNWDQLLAQIWKILGCVRVR
jgi:hypothetical protein